MEMIELTCIYDPDNLVPGSMEKRKVLIDTSQLEYVEDYSSMEGAIRGGCKIIFKPSVPAFGADDCVAQDQRTIIVAESYTNVRGLVNNVRGVVGS